MLRTARRLVNVILMSVNLIRLSGIIVTLAATSASAQESLPADWDVLREPSKKLVMAHTGFDVGLGIAVRCVDGGLEALISGLPSNTDEQRTIGVAFVGDERITDQQWNVAVNPTIAVSNMPAPFARKLRNGGELQLRIAGGAEDGRNLRYVLDLPASNAAIDETLTACDRPLVDPRDAAWAGVGDNGLPTNLQWLKRPRPTYPGVPRYERGFAVVTCIADPEGRPQDCVVETEHPRDAGFGQATLRAAREARLTNSLNPDAPITPSRFNFRANYNVSNGPVGPVTPSRIRRPN